MGKLREIFFRKAREVAIEVGQAESILNSAQEKINYLRSGNEFSLLRQEILISVDNLSKHQRQYGFYEESSTDIEKMKKEIIEIFDACIAIKKQVNDTAETVNE